MALESKTTANLTLRYYFAGGGGYFSDGYRSENPWAKLRRLRLLIADGGWPGLEYIPDRDGSVWRLQAAEDPERVARQLLEYIEARIADPWDTDDVRVILADGRELLAELA